MAELGLAIQQQGRANGSDSTIATAAGNRGGALVTSDPRAMYDQWLRAGKVFTAHGPDALTVITIPQNAAYDLTKPSFHLGVPSSKVFVLIRLKIANLAVWTTADGVTVGSSDTSAYTSGGVAANVRNAAAVSSLDSALGTSVATNVFEAGSSLLAPALTNVRYFDTVYYPTGNLAAVYEYNILKGDPMFMVHGPGSILAWIKLAAASASCLFVAEWAELDKSELVNN